MHMMYPYSPLCNMMHQPSYSSIHSMQAARLTASGNELRRLGQEIAARPFYYSDTPDLELQFFLTFTDSTRYQVNYYDLCPGLFCVLQSIPCFVFTIISPFVFLMYIGEPGLCTNAAVTDIWCGLCCAALLKFRDYHSPCSFCFMVLINNYNWTIVITYNY